MSPPGCVVLDQRGIVRLTGPDARGLLQGLISNDVDSLTPSRAVYAALLTPQGKYLFDFLLYQGSDEILLDTEAARAAALIQRLSMYRLRAQVAIENAGDTLAVLAVFGEGAVERLGLAAERGYGPDARATPCSPSTRVSPSSACAWCCRPARSTRSSPRTAWPLPRSPPTTGTGWRSACPTAAAT